jgi:serine/threonine-protein kinase
VEAPLRLALADLRAQHPAIAAVDDAFCVGDGSLAVLSEHRPGRLLIHALARPDLSFGDALQLACAMAESLAVAHAGSIFHLGLDPYRVVLGTGRRGLSIYGVGLVQAWQRCGGDPSQSFRVMATPAYRSPEQSSAQAAGETGASDVYALGVLAFEMLAKLHPFVARVAEDGSNAAATLKRVQPLVSAALADLVESMLGSDPRARPTMHEVAVALRGFAAASGAVDVEAVSARLSGSTIMRAVVVGGAGK